MILTTEQKNFVNPYPEDFSDSVDDVTIAEGGRNGEDYDYETPRNKFIQAGIHERFMSGLGFLEIGYGLTFPPDSGLLAPVPAGGDLPDGSRFLTAEDYLAYAAAYPQNAIVKRSRTVRPITEPWSLNPGPTPLECRQPSPADGLLQLEGIVERHTNLQKLLTETTEAAQRPENQIGMDVPINPDQPAEDPTGLTVKGKAARLTAVQSITDNAVQRSLRASFGVGDSATVPPPEPITDVVTASVANEGFTPDLRSPFYNAGADNPNPPVYYNSSDSNYYYVRRTNATNPRSYDVSLQEESAPVAENIRKLQIKGLTEILKKTGKFSTSRRSDSAFWNPLIQQLSVVTFQGDLDRPLPVSRTQQSSDSISEQIQDPTPPPRRRWIVSVSLDKSVIDGIPPAPPSDTNLPSAVGVSKAAVEGVSAKKYIPYKLSTLKENIKKTARVLRYYATRLEEDGMTPDLMSGYNLNTEADKVENFLSNIENFYAINQLVMDDGDKIELSLDIEYKLQTVSVNGVTYIKGTPLSKIVRQVPPPQPGVDPELSPAQSQTEPNEDVFADVTQTTFAYLWYSIDIAKLTSVAVEMLPSWEVFVFDYTYPNPIIYPTQIQQQKILRRGSTVAPSAKNKKVFNTAEEVSKQFKHRLEFTGKDLYMTVNKAAANCDTAQGKFLKNALLAYQTFTGKAKLKDLKNLAVTILRDQLISDQLTMYRIQKGAEFLEHPERAIVEIERAVNEELSCVLGIVGDAVMEQVINPMTKDPKLRSFFRNSIQSPRGLKLPKGPGSGGLMKVWRQQLEKLVIEHIKQMILNLLKDVISAALGCGPIPRNDEPQNPAEKDIIQTTYGKVQINKSIDDAGDIDLFSIAKLADLFNTLPPPEGEDDVEFITSPPTADQLRQFHKDTSDYLMEPETIALLDGNASSQTIGIINEMVNNGPVDLSGLNENQRSDALYLRARQESALPGDVRYATLGLNPDKIRRYYTALGEALQQLKSFPEASVSDDFCRVGEIPLPSTSELGLSEEQILSQINTSIDATLARVDTLCSLNPDSLDFNLGLENFLSGLPMPAFLDKILQAIADASNAAADNLAAIMASQASATSLAASAIDPEQTELYLAVTGFFAEDVQQVIEFNQQQDGLIPFGQPTYPFWAVENVNLTFNNDNTTMAVALTVDEDGENSYKVLSENPLSPNNTPLLGEEDRIPQEAPYVKPYPFLVRSPQGSPNLVIKRKNFPQFDSAVQSQIMNLISPAEALMAESVGMNPVNPQPLQFIKILSNTSENVRDQIVSFYQPIKPRRLEKFNQSISTPYFAPYPDKCITPRERVISLAAMAGIQNRIINFFMNVGPLMRVYGGWNTPDTNKMVVSYLYEKMKEGMTRKGVYALYLASMPIMARTMSKSLTPEEQRTQIELDINPISPPEDQMKYIILQSLKQVYLRAEQTNSYPLANKNLFEDGGMKRDFESLAMYIKTGRFSLGGEVYLNESGLEALPGEAGVKFTNRSDSAWVTQDFLDYVPLPNILALYIIDYDQRIAFAEKYPAFRFYGLRRVAAADDGLINAHNDTNLVNFESPFMDYPVVIEGKTYYSDEQIMERVQLLRARRERIWSLERLFGAMGIYEENYSTYSYPQRDPDSGTIITRGEEIVRLEKDLEQFRNSMNHVYTGDDADEQRVYAGQAGAMAKYLRSYSPEQRKQWAVHALKYNYEFTDASRDVVFTPGVEGSQFRAATSGKAVISQWAWYERARLLGDAGEPLITAYLRGEDFDTRFTAEDLAIPITQHDGEALTNEKWMKATRLWTINECAYVPDPDVRESLESLMSQVGYALLLLAISAGVGLAVGVAAAGSLMSIGLIYLAASLSMGPVGLLGLAGVAIASALGIFFAWLLGDDPTNNYADPNAVNTWDDYPSRPVRFIRARSVTVNTGEEDETTFSPMGNIAEDFYDAAAHIDGHANTMDKIALNHLYFDLANLTQMGYKKSVDPMNENNEINQLLEHIGKVEQTYEFPVYVVVNGEMEAFFSLEELISRRDAITNSSFWVSSNEIEANRVLMNESLVAAQSLQDQAETTSEEQYGEDHQFQGLQFSQWLVETYAEFATRSGLGEDSYTSDIIASIGRHAAAVLSVGASEVVALALSGWDINNSIENLIADLAENGASWTLYGPADFGVDLGYYLSYSLERVKYGWGDKAIDEALNSKNKLVGTRADQTTVVFLTGEFNFRGSMYHQPGAMDYIDNIQEGFAAMRADGIDFYEMSYSERRQVLQTDVSNLSEKISQIESI